MSRGPDKVRAQRGNHFVGVGHFLPDTFPPGRFPLLFFTHLCMALLSVRCTFQVDTGNSDGSRRSVMRGTEAPSSAAAAGR